MSDVCARLERCGALAKEADTIRERIIRLRSASTGTHQALSGMPRAQGKRDVVGNTVAQVEELIARWERTIALYLEMMGEADEAISSLPTMSMRVVLRYRYLDGMEWPDVADKACYSESHCRRLATAGIAELERRERDQTADGDGGAA